MGGSPFLSEVRVSRCDTRERLGSDPLGRGVYAGDHRYGKRGPSHQAAARETTLVLHCMFSTASSVPHLSLGGIEFANLGEVFAVGLCV